MNRPTHTDKFEIVTTTTGATSIRNCEVNEIMHNPVGPWKEANELYVEQSNLKQILNESRSEDLTIFDVGLGAGANALATLHCARSSNRAVRLISFEIDLNLIKFALKHSSEFSHFFGFENAIRALLENQYYREQNITWELLPGNFLECINKTPYLADLVFFDPYSPKVNTEMWTTSCFKKLYKKCSPEASLYTYSQSTRIRSALLEAGFFVGYGRATGKKMATTQASLKLENLTNPLSQRWLERWKRSDSQLPFDCIEPKELQRIILSHRQFSVIT